MNAVARLDQLAQRMKLPGFRATPDDVELVKDAAVLIDALETAMGKAAGMIDNMKRRAALREAPA